jgi:hypothetical protein
MQTLDLTDLVWEKNLTFYSSGGAYLKGAIVIDGARHYFKLSAYDNERGFTGFESAYEYLASKLGGFLGFNVLDCRLIKARISINGQMHATYAQETCDFLPKGHSKAVFEKHYVALRGKDESRLDFLLRLGFAERVNEMLVFDYLIYNRDRHCNNIELIKNDSLHIAPLFDNGISFFAPLSGNKAEIERFDVLSDNITNNDFGTRYLAENLKKARGLSLPPNRHNIHQVLQREGIEEYDELALLQITQGRSPNDNLFLVESA